MVEHVARGATWVVGTGAQIARLVTTRVDPVLRPHPFPVERYPRTP